MATQNGTENGVGSANHEENKGLHFTVGGPLYRFVDNPDPGDVSDQLNARLEQLGAMMDMAGNGVRDISSAYFWNAGLIVKECQDLAPLLSRPSPQPAEPASEQPSPTAPSELGPYAIWFNQAQDALVEILSLAQCAYDSICIADNNDERVAAASYLLSLIITRARDYDLDRPSQEDAA